MKTNTLFFLVAITFSLTAHAQITKGNGMMGGNASFSNKETFQNHSPPVFSLSNLLIN